MTDAPPGSEPYRLGEILWDYLRVTPQLDAFPGAPQDRLILVLGSPDLTVADHAADLLNRGVADHLVVSGGCPAPSCGRLEADAIGELITAQGIDPGQVILERASQHTSDHFWKTKDLLDDRKLMIGGANPPKFVILVPAPVAERRALATGRHRWPDSDFRVDGIPIGYEQYMAKTDHRLAIGRMVGEVERILYYPRRGYMDKPDQRLSELVIHAYDQLHPDFNTRPTPAPDPVLLPAAS